MKEPSTDTIAKILADWNAIVAAREKLAAHLNNNFNRQVPQELLVKMMLTDIQSTAQLFHRLLQHLATQEQQILLLKQ